MLMHTTSRVTLILRMALTTVTALRLTLGRTLRIRTLVPTLRWTLGIPLMGTLRVLTLVTTLRVGTLLVVPLRLVELLSELFLSLVYSSPISLLKGIIGEVHLTTIFMVVVTPTLTPCYSTTPHADICMVLTCAIRPGVFTPSALTDRSLLLFLRLTPTPTTTTATTTVTTTATTTLAPGSASTSASTFIVASGERFELGSLSFIREGLVFGLGNIIMRKEGSSYLGLLLTLFPRLSTRTPLIV